MSVDWSDLLFSFFSDYLLVFFQWFWVVISIHRSIRIHPPPSPLNCILVYDINPMFRVLTFSIYIQVLSAAKDLWAVRIILAFLRFLSALFYYFQFLVLELSCILILDMWCAYFGYRPTVPTSQLYCQLDLYYLICWNFQEPIGLSLEVMLAQRGNKMVLKN